MSADLLRRAAAKIRETAQAAEQSGGGPWWTPEEVVGVIGVNRDWDTPDADHIALWSPDVAELVARVLDDAVRYIDEYGLAPEDYGVEFDLARRVLGDAS